MLFGFRQRRDDAQGITQMQTTGTCSLLSPAQHQARCAVTESILSSP
jgi:hypothetical protein